MTFEIMLFNCFIINFVSCAREANVKVILIFPWEYFSIVGWFSHLWFDLLCVESIGFTFPEIH
jgi:hypothetical protein